MGKNIVTLARLDPVGALEVKRAVPLEGSLEGENGGECDCYLLGFSRKIPTPVLNFPQSIQFHPRMVQVERLRWELGSSDPFLPFVIKLPSLASSSLRSPHASLHSLFA